MAGRQRPSEGFDTLHQRVRLGYTDKGVAGVAKTVLLNDLRRRLSAEAEAVARVAGRPPA
jgi:hypothetical protein